MTGAASSAKRYLIIWGWLAGLMLAGVLLAESGLALAPALIVATVLVLALVKAVLVALYYMHLKSDRRLLALVLLAPFALLALVLVLLYSSTLVRL
jgi:cytochrome c oxidase subunit 4